MTDSKDLALKIMALVDEYPSGPFSLERKQIETQLEDMIVRHTQQIDNERDVSYDLGYEEGRQDGRDDAEQDYVQEINEIEQELEDVRRELEEANSQLDQAFSQGFEFGQK